MDQQGSSCCGSLESLSESYDSKVNPVDPLDAEKLAEAVLLNEFNIVFPLEMITFISLADPCGLPLD